MWPWSQKVVRNKAARVLVVSMGDTPEIAANAALDFDVYREFFADVEKHDVAVASDLNKLLDAYRFDIAHLLIKVGDKSSIHRNEAASLGNCLRNARPGLVWLAEENPIASYQSIRSKMNVKPAHLALTLERKGQLFPRFLRSLLTEMATGESFINSYVKLVPQASGPWHDSLPAGFVEVGSDTRRYKRENR
jgi:hypothetical protein